MMGTRCALKDERLLPRNVDGMREGDWIVADYLDVVLHVLLLECAPVLTGSMTLERAAAVDLDAAAV